VTSPFLVETLFALSTRTFVTASAGVAVITSALANTRERIFFMDISIPSWFDVQKGIWGLLHSHLEFK
jgi:hypothetical protein